MQYLSDKNSIYIKGVDTVIAEKIKQLRESKDMTQSQLAKILNITRSSVNAWEMGISVPSTQYIIELAKFFQISTDYLLGMKVTETISLQGLDEKDIDIIYQMAEHLKEKNK